MKKIFKPIYILLSLLFLFYLAVPGPDFPAPPPDALQSNEPGDTEDPLRRAYFTNYTREEVIQHYTEEFRFLPTVDFAIPTYRLNYPPEEAQTIIRDQTRSSFLEEIVHPFRESVFINGFRASSQADTIFIEDKVWLHKITVRYVPSSALPRVLVGAGASALLWVIFFEWKRLLTSLRKGINAKKH